MVVVTASDPLLVRLWLSEWTLPHQARYTFEPHGHDIDEANTVFPPYIPCAKQVLKCLCMRDSCEETFIILYYHQLSLASENPLKVLVCTIWCSFTLWFGHPSFPSIQKHVRGRGGRRRVWVDETGGKWYTQREVDSTWCQLKSLCT